MLQVALTVCDACFCEIRREQIGIVGVVVVAVAVVVDVAEIVVVAGMRGTLPPVRRRPDTNLQKDTQNFMTELCRSSARS